MERFKIAGFLRPSERRKRPHPRREPRIKCVGILLPAVARRRFHTSKNFFGSVFEFNRPYAIFFQSFRKTGITVHLFFIFFNGAPRRDLGQRYFLEHRINRGELIRCNDCFCNRALRENFFASGLYCGESYSFTRFYEAPILFCTLCFSGTRFESFGTIADIRERSFLVHLQAPSARACAIPHRDPVSEPDLARNAPVAKIFYPLEIYFRKSLR